MTVPTVPRDPPAWMQRDIEKLPPARRKTFVRFLRDKKLQGASHHTIANYVKAVRTIGGAKPYERLTERDLLTWQESINSNGWAEKTVDVYVGLVKAFLRRVGLEPELLEHVHRRRPRPKLPKILSKGEVQQLIGAATNQRDRALVFVTYESGARAGEILSLRIEDVEFDQFGAMLYLNKSKTAERPIRLVESVPDLRMWINMHPTKENRASGLWPGKRGPLGISGFENLLDKLGGDAGLEKHVHPHLLRHSRATHLAAGVLTEAQMRIHFGWSQSSRMPEIYVHLSARDTDTTLLRHYGIKVEAPTEDSLEPRACPWCGTQNSALAEFCEKCNAPLSPESANKAAELQRRRTELAERFIERMLQEVPETTGNVLREMRKELEELA